MASRSQPQPPTPPRASPPTATCSPPANIASTWPRSIREERCSKRSRGQNSLYFVFLTSRARFLPHHAPLFARGEVRNGRGIPITTKNTKVHKEEVSFPQGPFALFALIR